MTPAQRQNQIDEIVRNFDFGKVEEAMRCLNWQWRSGVPNLEQIRNCAVRLMMEVQDGHRLSTGGFEAQNEDGYLGLKFVLTRYSTDPDAL